MQTLNDDPRNNTFGTRNRGQDRQILERFISAFHMGPSDNQRLNINQLSNLPCSKFKKNPNEKQEGDKETCPICCCDYEDGEDVRNLSCTHMFHKECIDTWLVRKSKCPLCRTDLRN